MYRDPSVLLERLPVSYPIHYGKPLDRLAVAGGWQRGREVNEMSLTVIHDHTRSLCRLLLTHTLIKHLLVGEHDLGLA